jgi:hypothetical protein
MKGGLFLKGMSVPAVSCRGGTWLCNRQCDLASEPLLAPVKTHLTSELASKYIFHNARAEAAARSRPEAPSPCGFRCPQIGRIMGHARPT